MTAPVRDLDAPVVEVRDLRKSYGDVVALDGLDLEIGRGEVHGFLGPNGAGKSTTIRILLGLLRHDGGVLALALALSGCSAPPSFGGGTEGETHTVVCDGPLHVASTGSGITRV